MVDKLSLLCCCFPSKDQIIFDFFQGILIFAMTCIRNTDFQKEWRQIANNVGTTLRRTVRRTSTFEFDGLTSKSIPLSSTAETNSTTLKSKTSVN